ncbi:Hypothetical predicted protein [Mytilus galloprovincialis]|uniref:Farnesoic acid O-methyl transferase domain-containing protein n=1 Tax=Mytilus galloprovincialis TaxID=29158 RepID=A0A8B6ETE9_MYTGA|nr:Hypothetical predicted protein [Mytilus galloprovincialis]
MPSFSRTPNNSSSLRQKAVVLNRYLEVRTFSGSQIPKLKKLDEYYVSLSNHSFYPPQTKSFTFSLKASPSASIVLSSAVNLRSKEYYAIGIGVGNNLKFILRKHVNSTWRNSHFSKEANNTILDGLSFRNFTIKWSNGIIHLVQDCNLNFEWTDNNPIQIKGIALFSRNIIAKTSSGSRVAAISPGNHATTESSSSHAATISTKIHATTELSDSGDLLTLSGKLITNSILSMPIRHLKCVGLLKCWLCIFTEELQKMC